MFLFVGAGSNSLLEEFRGCSMTKQNVVVVTEAGEMMAQADINMALKIAAMVETTSLLPPPVPSQLAAGYIAISRRKLVKKLEIGGTGEARISAAAWVDAMKASSPTHLKSVLSFSSPKDDSSSWMVSLHCILLASSMHLYICMYAIYAVLIFSCNKWVLFSVHYSFATHRR